MRKWRYRKFVRTLYFVYDKEQRWRALMKLRAMGATITITTYF